MNLQGYVRKRSWPTSGIIRYLNEGVSKTMKHVTIADNPVLTGNKHPTIQSEDTPLRHSVRFVCLLSVITPVV